eukprot:403363739
MASEDRYVFMADWYDQQASLNRKFYVALYLSDKTIDIYDIKNKRLFLKRTRYPQVSEEDLYVGSTITVFSRQYKIVDYADDFTRKAFDQDHHVEKTFAMIKPDSYTNIGKIIQIIEQGGFKISNLRMLKLSQSDTLELYADKKNNPFIQDLVNFISSDMVVGLELVRESAISVLQQIMGPSNSLMAKNQSPNSIRGTFGKDSLRNAIHGSDSSEAYKRESSYFFNNQRKSTALLNNCTCCLIKPHAIQNRQVGKILDAILGEGFEISALEMFYLDKSTAEEFFEIYKGIMPEYSQMIDHVSSGGPVIALEIRQDNAVDLFRRFCGPHDPDQARDLNPKSLRAKHGLDKIRNGVHCTDLAEDGVLECEYFFSILQHARK